MESVRTGLLNRLWWIPLAFVVVALLALLSTPVLVSRRVNALRDSFEIPNKGRVVINDLEAAIATELLLKGRLDAPRAAADERDSAYETARAQAQADESELDSITQRLGPEAVRRFASFRALGRESAGPWRRALVGAMEWPVEQTGAPRFSQLPNRSILTLPRSRSERGSKSGGFSRST